MNKTRSLANLAAAGLLGAVLAYWSWVWLAPAAAARAPAAPEASGSIASASGLFGTAKLQGAGTAASGSIRLMGVFAASGERRGYAVLRLDSKKTVAVPQGEEVEPGLRLVEIQVDRVVLERNGARETLAWPEKVGK